MCKQIRKILIVVFNSFSDFERDALFDEPLLVHVATKLDSKHWTARKRDKIIELPLSLPPTTTPVVFS
jgi:hypothetical protein